MSDFINDIPASLAYAAHAGTSFVPERRAEQVRQGHAEHMSGLYAELLKHAPTDEKRATLDEEFARFREGYVRRYRAYLASNSRVMSSMITGPSNFPVRRMQKRNEVCHRRLTELTEFEARAKDAILKALHPEWRPIMSGDANAEERLEDKIAEAEEVQARMKACNLAIRKHKAQGAVAQVAALVALGMLEVKAQGLLKPDFCGRIGFPDFELTNNNANIRRMKERLAAVSRNKSEKETSAQGEHAEFADSPPDNRVRLIFPGKPAEAIRSELKRSGFRWSPTNGAWQAYRNAGTIATAKRIAGVQ